MTSLSPKNAGFTLIQVVIFAALSLGGIYLATNQKVLGLKKNRKTELQGQIESLRNIIVNDLDCRATTGKANTKPPFAACASSDYTNQLKNKQGNALFDLEADGTIKGTDGYVLQAKCDDPTFGMYFMVNRMKNGQLLKDPMTNSTQLWKDLFARQPIRNFCQEFFGLQNESLCEFSDQVITGTNPDGKSQCESIYDLMNFKICLQFSDHGCSAQVGPARCTPCSWSLSEAVAPDEDLVGEWAFDTNRYDPDCAKIFFQSCDEPDPATGTEAAPFVPSTRQITLSGASCVDQCAANEIMVGAQIGATGSVLTGGRYSVTPNTCQCVEYQSCGCDEYGNNCSQCCVRTDHCWVENVQALDPATVRATNCTITCQSRDLP